MEPGKHSVQIFLHDLNLLLIFEVGNNLLRAANTLHSSDVDLHFLE